MSRAGLVAILLALPGCTSPPEPAEECFDPVRPIDIPGFTVRRQGEELLWTVHVANTGCHAEDGLGLRLTVRYASPLTGARAPDETREAPVGTLSAGQASSHTIATAYHGYGDYSGPVEVFQGGHLAARNVVFYEECAAPC